jgi:uncharacterized protein
MSQYFDWPQNSTSVTQSMCYRIRRSNSKLLYREFKPQPAHDSLSIPFLFPFPWKLQDQRRMADPTRRPPFPPFTRKTATMKVRLAEDAWNSRNPEKVAQGYTVDCPWRNRAEFPTGRKEIIELLTRKWSKELDYRLIKELWAFDGNRIAVRFAYEFHDDAGNWFRAYGNENWEYDENGLNCRRYASINDLPIKESERKFYWPLGRRPDDHPSLSSLGL